MLRQRDNEPDLPDFQHVHIATKSCKHENCGMRGPSGKVAVGRRWNLSVAGKRCCASPKKPFAPAQSSGQGRVPRQRAREVRVPDGPPASAAPRSSDTAPRQRRGRGAQCGTGLMRWQGLRPATRRAMIRRHLPEQPTIPANSLVPRTIARERGHLFMTRPTSRRVNARPPSAWTAS